MPGVEFFLDDLWFLRGTLSARQENLIKLHSFKYIYPW